MDTRVAQCTNGPYAQEAKSESGHLGMQHSGGAPGAPERCGE